MTEDERAGLDQLPEDERNQLVAEAQRQRAATADARGDMWAAGDPDRGSQVHTTVEVEVNGVPARMPAVTDPETAQDIRRDYGYYRNELGQVGRMNWDDGW